MQALQRSALPIVVSQHLEDAVALRSLRSMLVHAPHVKLLHLSRADERLSAHLDGLQIAGNDGAALGQAALAVPGIGQLFVSAVLAIERRDAAQLDRLMALSDAIPDAMRALASAFGWVSPPQLRGLIVSLLGSPSATTRRLGVAACALHRVNAGEAIKDGISQPDAALRIRALQAAGELGRLDLLPTSLEHLNSDNPRIAIAAAASAALLGDRQAAVEALGVLARNPSPGQVGALTLVLKMLAPEQAHALLKPLAQDAAMIRTLIHSIGIAGDPHYIPWLIKQMSDLKLTRLAGESFSLITGLDLAFVDLDCKPPEKLEFGPNDDPADTDVAMDEDDSLPWPDPEKIAAWWAAHGARFKPGTRYFMGEPPSIAHCRSVLRGGFQRQRIAAAEYLCLLAPGTPLFNTAAPAWRQERLLAQMETT